MKLVCAECKKVLKHCIKGTEGDERISHGLCPGCAKMAKDEIQKMFAEKEYCGSGPANQCLLDAAIALEPAWKMTGKDRRYVAEKLRQAGGFIESYRDESPN